MDHVFTEDQNPQTKIKHAAVAIRKAQGGRHVGLVYKQEGGWRMLHLGWHKQLHDNPMPYKDARHVWVDPEPAIDEARLEILAALCRLISERNIDAGLPYGFSSPKNWFDPFTGAARFAPDGMGLTCASFVLAVFSSNGSPLINEETWIVRDKDKHYQEWVIQRLEESEGVSPEHKKRVHDDIPAIRYRPEEVAGAAACDSIPADFVPCCEMGTNILKLLENHA